jgi:CHAT domain-containing protein
MANPDFGLPISPDLIAASIQLGQRSPDLDRGGLIFRPLGYTSLEAKDLAALLKLQPENLLVQGNATEGRLKNLHGPRILHLASHGFFLNDQDLPNSTELNSTQTETRAESNPLLRSGIALSGANARRSGPKDDGIFTALEAAQLDLHGTELVVLSACDTGIGEVLNGEGVYGLRRALVLAGAQTQVTSLWKVSDEATRILMVDFYKRLLAGEGRSEALRHAQQNLMADPKYAHPYYWASFVPIGNWTPLPARTH